MPAPASEQTSSANRLGGAIDRLRETAKWLIVSFAAVGGVVVAGSQLSDLGTLDTGTGRFWIALLGALVALGGVTAAIGFIGQVLVDPPVGMRSLTAEGGELAGIRAELEKDVALVPDGDLIKLKDDYVAARRRQRAAYQAYVDAPSKDSQTKAQIVNGEAVVRATEVERVLEVAQLMSLQRRFDAGRLRTLIATGVAATGLIAFAAASNPGASVEAPTAIVIPSSATAKLTDAGLALYRQHAGHRCKTRRPQVVVLGVTAAGSDVVTVPSSHCGPVRFRLTAVIGSLHTAS